MVTLERAESATAPSATRPTQGEPVDTRNIFDRGVLHDTEIFWRTHQPWLDELGYTVRPRYKEGWKASWLEPGAKSQWFESEDGQILRVSSSF
jgi:hypothetical protein